VNPLGPQDVYDYLERWRIVAAAERLEAAATALDVRFLQCASLLASRTIFSSGAAPPVRDAGIPDRWARIRAVSRA
jgi:hypothetical protein